MAILSTLLAVGEPSGVWISIIRGFEGFTNHYVLAVILLTVIIRLIWSPIDLLNKRMSQKMALVQAKMQPEVEKLKAKYANDPKQLQQKQNELYKKNNANTMGSCVFMLVFMGLNLAIFLTLFTGLNAMSVYKISENYEHLKSTYANCLDTTASYINQFGNDVFKDYQHLTFQFETKQGQEYVQLLQKEEDKEEPTVIFEQLYYQNIPPEDDDKTTSTKNDYIVSLINNYISPEAPVILIPEIKDAEGNVTQAELTLSAAIQSTIMDTVKVTYDQTKDSFLWIQNIWVADSPFQTSIFNYKTFADKVGSANMEKSEETVYNAFMKQLSAEKGSVNGYFILPIICILATFLSMMFATRKKKGQPTPPPAAGSGKVMKYLMPIIFGIFALFYNSVFAIYMAVGQIISGLLTPLQNLILDKWQAQSDKKKQKKVEVVDYSRKF